MSSDKPTPQPAEKRVHHHIQDPKATENEQTVNAEPEKVNDGLNRKTAPTTGGHTKVNKPADPPSGNGAPASSAPEIDQARKTSDHKPPPRQPSLRGPPARESTLSFSHPRRPTRRGYHESSMGNAYDYYGPRNQGYDMTGQPFGHATLQHETSPSYYGYGGNHGVTGGYMERGYGGRGYPPSYYPRSDNGGSFYSRHDTYVSPHNRQPNAPPTSGTDNPSAEYPRAPATEVQRPQDPTHAQEHLDRTDASQRNSTRPKRTREEFDRVNPAIQPYPKRYRTNASAPPPVSLRFSLQIPTGAAEVVRSAELEHQRRALRELCHNLKRDGIAEKYGRRTFLLIRPTAARGDPTSIQIPVKSKVQTLQIMAEDMLPATRQAVHLAESFVNKMSPGGTPILVQFAVIEEGKTHESKNYSIHSHKVTANRDDFTQNRHMILATSRPVQFEFGVQEEPDKCDEESRNVIARHNNKPSELVMLDPTFLAQGSLGYSGTAGRGGETVIVKVFFIPARTSINLASP